MAGKGGSRPNSGRKPWDGEEFKVATARYIESRYKDTPLDYLLNEMTNTRNTKAVRIDCAKAALPYCHPRLAHLHMTGRVEHTHEKWLDSIDGEARPALDVSDADFEEIAA